MVFEGKFSVDIFVSEVYIVNKKLIYKIICRKKISKNNTK